jgi:hypothetical protein
VPTSAAVPAKSATSKLRRYISLAILVILIGALLLMFHQPAPVAPPMKRADVAANAESFQQKLSTLVPAAKTDDEASAPADAAAEIHLTAEEVQAALVQANDPSMAPRQGSASASQAASDEQLTLDPSAPVVTFENDEVRGQFQAELAGKKVVVTVAGHLGEKDGYATFDPTDFKIGGLTVPVSLVNEALQKKMLEQRDRLKLPEFVSDIGVQNSQLVIKRK